MCVLCGNWGLPAASQTAATGFSAQPANRDWQFATYTGDATLDSLLIGPRWTGTALTYATPLAQAEWGDSFITGTANSLHAPTAAMDRAIDLILAGETSIDGVPQHRLTSLASFTLLDLARTTDSAVATLRIGAADQLPDVYGFAAPPGSEQWMVELAGAYPTVRGGDTWLSVAAFPAGPGDLLDPVIGGLGWHVLTHEMGHALGLAHPHQGPGQAGGTIVAMPDALNSVEFTNMAYKLSPDGTVDDQSPPGSMDLPQSWMTYDIRALQHLYGANYESNAGASTYRFNPDTGEVRLDGLSQGVPGANRILLTIWDGGGFDTYDFSAYATGLRIDLAPGAGSLLSATQLADLTPAGLLPGTRMAQNNLYNAFLYQDDPRALIENALGGSGDDRIAGNQAGNLLSGGAGNDTLIGLEGADTLVGGAGADSLVGGTGDDTYYVDHAQDRVVELEGGGTDQVIASVNWRLGAAQEVLVLAEVPGAWIGHGNAGTNRIEGNSLDNFLTGGGGNDALSGHAGADRLDGNDGDDLLYGGDGDDRLYGGAGNDVLVGGAGRDRMVGHDGNDGYMVTDLGDLVLEQARQGQDTVYSSLDYYRLVANVEELVLTFGAGIGVGNAQGNLTRGNTGDNILSGMAGNDTLLGGFGNDSLLGGDGDDVLSGGAGDDRLIGGAGNDTMGGGQGRDTLLGGAGADVFGLEDGFTGHTILADFNPAEDRVDISSYFLNFAGLSPYLSAMGSHTTLSVQTGGSMLLRGVALADVTEAMFIFVSEPDTDRLIA